jgi:putative membrane protein
MPNRDISKLPLNPASVLGSAVLVLGLIAAGPAHAQTSGSSGSSSQGAAESTGGAPGTSQMLSRQDEQFLTLAGPANLAEIQMGKLAMQRGATPAVREFGRWMVTDHTMAYKELTLVTQRMYPSAAKPMITSRQAMQYKKLEALHGVQFDRAYLQANVLSHEQSMAMFKTESNDGKDLLIKGFATNLLPVLQQHMIEVRELIRKP